VKPCNGAVVDQNERIRMQHTEHHLPRDLDAPARSRRLVENWVAGHPRRHEIVLAVSEIVANAVTHGDPIESGITLRFVSDGSLLRVAVLQRGSAFEPRINRELSGLKIVDDIVDRWGIDEEDGHVDVWFEIDNRVESESNG
jgi:anti-sigma regulatory factor (Ser/Thr protein kinase)